MRRARLPWRKTMQRWAIVIATLLTLGLVGFTIATELDPPDAAISSAAPVVAQISSPVLADRPVVILSQGGDISAYVPCCSLGIGGTVALVEEAPDLLSEPPRLKEWYRPRVVALTYTDRQGETVPNAYSSTPIELCFDLNDQEWRAFQQEPEAFQLQYYDDIYRPNAWRRTSYYTPEGDQSLCTSTNRVRLVALAVREEAIPLTGGVVPGP